MHIRYESGTNRTNGASGANIKKDVFNGTFEISRNTAHAAYTVSIISIRERDQTQHHLTQQQERHERHISPISPHNLVQNHF